MRIGIVCYPTYGGSGVVASELGKHLAGRGHVIHFISYDLPFRLRDFHQDIIYHAVEIPSYPLFPDQPYLLALANKLVEVVRYHHLDLLHVHYAIPHATAAYLARQMLGGQSPKIVTTLHGTDITLVGNSPSFHDITAFSIENSDGVTAVSNHLARQTAEQFGINRKIATIYNFVDPNEYAPQASSSCRFRKNGEKVLIHISNFRPVKRVSWAVRVFLKLREQRLPVRLILVGDGPDAAEARALIYQQGMQDYVHFVGKQDQVTSLLTQSDLLILPSLLEAFGLVALEAMSCQVPVVASKVGGIPEVIEDGISGRLIPAEDFNGFVEACRQLLFDDPLRRQMGINGREAALQRFSADRIISEYEAYYAEVMTRS